jgi:hypothetical protein
MSALGGKADINGGWRDLTTYGIVSGWSSPARAGTGRHENLCIINVYALVTH